MGATGHGLHLINQFLVSTHAPAMGATTWRPQGLAFQGCFNPRARDGRDPATMAVHDMFSNVSTHAPAMGATPVVISH